MLNKLIMKIPFTWLRIISLEEWGKLHDILEVNWVLNPATAWEFLKMRKETPEARIIYISFNNSTKERQIGRWFFPWKWRIK